MRHELLNGEHFDCPLEGRVVIARWVSSYNTLRPYRSLGYETPVAFYEASVVGNG